MGWSVLGLGKDRHHQVRGWGHHSDAGNEQLLVNVGDRVNPGTEIARLGVSPQGGGAKLYFSIQGANGQFVDPEKFFSDKSHA